MALSLRSDAAARLVPATGAEDRDSSRTRHVEVLPQVLDRVVPQSVVATGRLMA